jgi:phosphate transport system substrate-binding protein
MKNRDGQFVKADDSSFKAAAAGAEWEKAPSFYKILTNEAGRAAWPISGASFVLMHKVQERPLTGSEVLKFFNWSYQHGGAIATKLDYVPLPDNLLALIQVAWKNQIKDSNGDALWR